MKHAGDITNTCNHCKRPNREGSNIQENNLGTILSGIIFIIVWLVLLVIGVTTVYICKLVSRKKKQSLIVRGGKPAIRKMLRVQLLTTVSNHQVYLMHCFIKHCVLYPINKSNYKLYLYCQSIPIQTVLKYFI